MWIVEPHERRRATVIAGALARVELFKTVVFDFKEVEQAFADESFRVFANGHPEISLHAIHASSQVKRLSGRVLGGLRV